MAEYKKLEHDIDIIRTLSGPRVRYMCDVLISKGIKFNQVTFGKCKRLLKSDMVALLISCLFDRMSLDDRFDILKANYRLFNGLNLQRFVSEVEKGLSYVDFNNTLSHSVVYYAAYELINSCGEDFGLFPFREIKSKTIKKLVVNSNGVFGSIANSYYRLGDFQIELEDMSGVNGHRLSEVKIERISKDEFLSEMKVPNYTYTNTDGILLRGSERT